MERKESEPKSSADSPLPDWLDLDLPEVTEENAPLPAPVPSFSLSMKHALMLIRGLPEEFWEKRRAMKNHERFEL